MNETQREQIETALANAAAKPATYTVDGETVQQRPLSDLIDAIEFADKRIAASKNRSIRFNKLIPPGAP